MTNTYPLMLVVGKLLPDKRHAKKSATRFSSTNIRVRSEPVQLKKTAPNDDIHGGKTDKQDTGTKS